MVKFSAPGPSVERQTPGDPVSRPWVAAMKDAACSWRVSTSSIREVRSDFDDVEVFLAREPENALDAFILQRGDEKVGSLATHRSRLLSLQRSTLYA